MNTIGCILGLIVATLTFNACNSHQSPKGQSESVPNETGGLPPLTVKLQAFNKKYLTINHQDNTIAANSTNQKDGAWFEVVEIEGGRIALKGANNKYISVERSEKGKVTAAREQAGDWENFQFIDIDKNHLALKNSNGAYLAPDSTCQWQLFGNHKNMDKETYFAIELNR